MVTATVRAPQRRASRVVTISSVAPDWETARGQHAAEVEDGAVGGGQRGRGERGQAAGRAEHRYCPYTAALSEEPLAMNRTCLVSRPSAASSPTWASSASKVLLSASGCSAISIRIRLGTDPQKWTSPIRRRPVTLPRKRVRPN